MSDVTKNFEIKQQRSEANDTGQTLVEGPVDEELPGADEAAEAAAHDVTPTQAGDDQPSGKRPLYKRPVVLVVASIIVIVGVVIGVRYWNYARAHESTDDAFIDGHIIQISPQVSGYVLKVYVNDNQQVKPGDLIVEIDPRDYEAKLQQARAALDAGLAKHKESRTNVSLTRATGAANIRQAKATVRQAQSAVESSQAGAASSQSRTHQAASSVSTAQANVEQARAQVAAAEAEVTRANSDLHRYETLYAKDEISKQQLDNAVAAARTASAQLDASRQKVAATLAQVNEARSSEAAIIETARQSHIQISGAQASVDEAIGRLATANTAPQQVAVSEAQSQTAGATTEQLQAEVDRAELELSYTKIYATEAGRVTRKSVEQGALVQVGQPLLAIVPGNVWVTANFEESQVGKIVAGQPVEIRVDAYPDRTFKGHVDSIQAGTGARFSLIPPENATGNYIKVVQRVPVKIVFDEPPDPKHMLAPGMSVVPEVVTG